MINFNQKCTHCMLLILAVRGGTPEYSTLDGVMRGKEA